MFALCVVVIHGSASGQRLYIDNLGPDDGLVGVQTWSTFQDTDGFIWLGMTGGVTRYDGTSFTNFTIADGLPDPLVRTIIQTPDGALWFGFNSGVAMFDGKKIRAFTTEDGLGGGAVWDSLVDSNGRLWFATQEGGLTLFEDGTFRSWGRGDGLPDDYVYALEETSDGAIWVGTRNHGAARFEPADDGSPSNIQTLTTEDGLTSNAIRVILEGSDGTLYFGTRGGGVSSWDGENATSFTVRDGAVGNDVYAMIINSPGELVIGTLDGGVSICEIPGFQNCRNITKTNGLGANTVYSLLEDREQNLWIGVTDGSSRLQTENLKSFEEEEGIVSSTVVSVDASQADDVWFATTEGVSRYRAESSGTGRFENFTTANGLPSDSTWTTLRDRNGIVWIGTSGGLARFDGRSGFDVYTTSDGLLADLVYSIFEDRDGALWLSSISGVTRMQLDPGSDRPKFTSYTVDDGLSGSQVYSIGQDETGRIWLGTSSNGITILDDDGVTYLSTENGLGSNTIDMIFRSRNGTMWVGASGGGLARYVSAADGGSFITYGAEAGIEAESVSTMDEDAQGLLWLGTDRGIQVFDPELRREDGETGGVVQRMDRETGLLSNRVPDVFVDPNERIWFTSERGATLYDPSLGTTRTTSPVVRILSVGIGNTRTLAAPFSVRPSSFTENLEWLGESVEIPHDQRSVRFEFSALSFKDRAKLAYQYRLVGFDDDWSDDTRTQFKEYTNLEKGTYTFSVRARNAEGVWSTNDARFEVVVLPALWQTWWARSGFSALLVLLIVTGHKARTRHIRNRSKELEQIVEERTDEITEYSHQLEQRAEDLEKANIRIREADRAKSKFLASMSHELRTPMNAIIGFSEILGNELDDQRQNRFVTNISDSGHHLLNLINNLLDLSKIESGKMDVHVAPVNPAELIEGVREIVTSLASRTNVTIEVELNGPMPDVRVDGPKIKQILYNLVSNAIKFSPAGERVIVSARVVSGSESTLGTESLEIAVTDHGRGIGADDQEFIFEEFRQIDDDAYARGGSGLGLAIVRKLAEIQGGSVEVQSELDVGSTFRLLVPTSATPRGPASLQPARPPAHPSAKGPSTVMIVEDEEDYCTELKERLEAAGFETVWVRNGEEVLRVAQHVRPSIITLDILLPGIDGWEVLRKLKQDDCCTSIPIVIVSRMANRELGFALGADDFVVKSVEESSLVGRLERLLPASGHKDERPTILVIDDDPAVHELIKELLHPRGYDVSSATNGQSGIDLAAAIVPAAIFLDLLMPGLNGFEVAKALRKNPATASIPLVVLTAKDLTDNDLEQLNGHIASLLEKGGTSSAELLKTIQDLVGRREPGRSAG